MARHLLEAGLDEISAAGSLLTTEASERSTTRTLSEAARGLELIVKALVAHVHWSQIFDDPSKASMSDLASGDFKSASTDACFDRLERLTGFKLSEAHRSRLTSMRKRRNAFEHFRQIDNIQALRGAMGSALHVVVELLSGAEDEDLLPAGGAGARTRLAQELSEFDRFARSRMSEVSSALNGVEAFECPRCSQAAAVIDDGLDCRFCCSRTQPEISADYYVERVMNLSKYEALKGGGNWPVFGCVNCDCDTLVQLDGFTEGQRAFLCFGCASEWEYKELEPCVYCNRMVPAGEGAMCSECFSDRMDRE